MLWVNKDNNAYFDLVLRIKRSEEPAFEMLFKLFYKQLLQYALVYVKHPHIAEEIVHDSFLKIWEIRSTIDENQSLKAFLYRCVHNNSINYLNKVKVTNRLAEEYGIELLHRGELFQHDPNDRYFEQLSNDDLIEKIKKNIQELPSQCREIFMMCRIYGLTYNQIAEKLNISVNTVKTQLSRAMQKIRDEIKNPE